MAFIEAQACGLPVVAGNGGGVASVVAAERTGLLVPVGDAAAFAAAVSRLDARHGAAAANGRGSRSPMRRAQHDLRRRGRAHRRGAAPGRSPSMVSGMRAR